MTKQHHAPSKFEEFLAIAGAALGFSLLFMFALSSFVNTLYQQEGEHAAHSQMATSDSGHNKPMVKYVLPGKGGSINGKNAAAKSNGQKPAKAASTAKGPSLGKLLAQANVKKGAKVAKKCAACHSFDKNGKDKVGPNLYGIVGKKIAGNKGFRYSSAMNRYAKTAGNWQYNNLGDYLQKPKKVVPKTKMAFAGIRKPNDLVNLIAFLRSKADKQVPLPLY